jgi:hypothetical protein
VDYLSYGIPCCSIIKLLQRASLACPCHHRTSRILNHIVTSVPVCEAQRAPSQPALQANQEEAQEDALQAKELPKRHTQREPEARAAAVATAALAQTASPPLDALLLRLHRQNQRWLRKAS